MQTDVISRITLLGALLIAEGLITQAQLDDCLRLQERLYAGTPIGQLLLRRGYISEENLARMVGKQRAFRRALTQVLETSLDAASQSRPENTVSATYQSLPELAAFADDEFEHMRAWSL